jgi:glycerol-3-phosphate dehydrogenase
MIVRDPNAAEGRPHDLVVIGGGIYGCTLALEAARRGLRPLLLERDDFGEHTSGQWLRILHGGLRYLQTMDLGRLVESVEARRWFLRRFPDLVEPLPCAMPLYGRGLRSRPGMALALAASDLLSARRNAGVRPDRRLPRGRILSTGELLARAPSVEREGLAGGALWYDAVARRPERLLLEILRWAVAEGATALNHVGAEGLERGDGRVRGVVARDRVTNRLLTFRAPVVVSCAGPWTGALARTLDGASPTLFRPSLALNVLFDRTADFDAALAVRAPRPGARTYFLLPWRGRVLAGTYHAPASEASGADEPAFAFARELDEVIPALDLGSSPILQVFAGRLPVTRDGTVDLASREVLHDHGAHGGPTGLFSVSGVKYTVARTVALRTLAHLTRAGHVRPTRPPSDHRPAPADVPDAVAMAARIERDPAGARALLGALADAEAVVEPEDLLLRRTGWALDPAAPPELADFVHRALAGRGGGRER